MSKRALVFDDDPDVNATICSIAARAGFSTSAAHTYPEFIAQYESWNPTHIIVDLAMPDRDGIETLHLLAKARCSAVIIIVSGLGLRVLEAAARAATESGLLVAGILPKPFSSAKLRELLAAATPDPEAGWPSSPDAASAFEVTETALAAALSAREVGVYYQPKVSCASGALIGFEGLARWHRPSVGVIMPDQFIPVAEHCELIGELTRQIFEQGLSWLARSFRDDDTKLALNLSAKLLQDSVLPSWIFQECTRLSIDTKRIVIEITETSTIDNFVFMLEVLTQFRIRGFNLSIDDFGVGYSSLVQLSRLPFSELKIDKMFVTEAETSAEAQKITSAIVGLSRALGLHVTAEGVENHWTLDFLKTIGCDSAQGYLIARPMPPDVAVSWARSQCADQDQRTRLQA
jgi:EAL domain-containing protein (putative c-di-GMP-specific phosphodiesterase class I)/CheY-like chemotaxis protein